MTKNLRLLSTTLIAIGIIFMIAGTFGGGLNTAPGKITETAPELLPIGFIICSVGLLALVSLSETVLRHVRKTHARISETEADDGYRVRARTKTRTF